MKKPINISFIKSKPAFVQHIVAIALITLCCLITSCKKLVEVGTPTNSLATTNVFNNDGTAITAQLTVYTKLQSFLITCDLYTGLSADELTNYSSTQLNIDLYRNNLNAQKDGGVNGVWSVLYNIIYQENAIIENVQSSKGISQRVKQLMIGEAQFMRAWSYFQLVNMFGDVPLIISTDYTKNNLLPRAAKDQVYNLMVNDLQAAQGLLSGSYLDAGDNPGVTDRVRPTTWAADALLARVYLFEGKYDLADQQAHQVISNTSMFSLASDLTKVFKMNSTEAIWQIMPSSTALFTPEGNNFILTTTPASSTGKVAISQQLLRAFEPNDKRYTNWISSITVNGTTYNFPYKYRDNNKASALNEYSMALRLAEQYLIRAEAEANGAGNGLNGAVSDLNIIRKRAGLPNYTGTIDKPNLLTAIAHERQVELFTENDRWFNLKRAQTVDGIMTIATSQKGGVWNSNQQLYPLVVTDLQYDPQLVQNPGY
jgi:hypothetical protein